MENIVSEAPDVGTPVFSGDADNGVWVWLGLLMAETVQTAQTALQCSGRQQATGSGVKSRGVAQPSPRWAVLFFDVLCLYRCVAAFPESATRHTGDSCSGGARLGSSASNLEALGWWD